jgi:predicted nucleic acid-binding Zn ribbon protein
MPVYFRRMTDRFCVECRAPLVGRIDKRFCSDQCRSTHNNRRHSESNRYVREVNNILRKNRRILDELNPGGKVKVPASHLKAKGFDFRYHTGTSHVRDGGRCYHCYDQGYVPLEKSYYLLVLLKEHRR